MCFGGGTRAFCCDTPGTYNNAYVTDFKNHLQLWVNEPTCPFEQTYQRSGLKARDMDDGERHNVSSLDVRDFKKFGGYTELYILQSALKGDTYIKKLLLKAYDDIVAAATKFSAADLTKYLSFQDETEVPTLTSLREIFCDGAGAVEELGYLQQEGDLCLLTPGPSKRFFRGDPVNVNRLDGQVPNANGIEPTTGAIMDAVMQGTIPLLYMTNLAYRPQPSRQFQDTELEGE
jgi:hypothetical protein